MYQRRITLLRRGVSGTRDEHTRVPLVRVASALEECQRGSGAFLAIVGPAGIGKSTLLAEVVRLAEDGGVRHLAATGNALVRSVPYAGVRELFAPVFGQRSSWDADRALSGAAALARPALAGDRAAGALVESRAASLHGLSWLALNLAEQGPLLITVDDIHLLDAETLDWLVYLRNRLESVSLMVVVASRPTRAGEPADALIASTSAERVIEPQPFGTREIGRLAGSMGVPLADDQVQDVLTATAGLPFLVRAVLAAYAESGDPRAFEIKGAALQAGILQRINDTAPDALAIAQRITILGPDAHPHLVARLAGVEVAAVLSSVEALERAQLVRRSATLHFVHDLVEEVVASSLGVAQRETLHAEAARVLAEHGAGLDRIAAHLMRTSPSGDPEHLSVLDRAAADALHRGAPWTAADYLRRLLAEALPVAQRAAFLHRLGQCGVEMGAPDTTESLFAAVQLSVEPRDRVAATRDLAKALLLEGRLVEAFRTLRDVSEGLDPDCDGALSLKADALGLGMLSLLDDSEVRPLADQLAPLLRYDGRDADRRLAAALSFDGFRRAAPAHECAALAVYGLEGVLDHPTELALSPALLAAHVAHLYSGRVEEARILARAGQRWASERGAPALYFACGFQDADVAAYIGDLAVVDAFGRAVQQGFEDGVAPLFAAATALPLDVWGMLERGRSEDAYALLDGYGVLDLPTDTLLFSGQLLVRGLVHLNRGDAARAHEDLAACDRLQARAGHRNAAAVPWRRAGVEALAALGRADEALALAEEDVDCARRFGEPRAIGYALLTRSRVASRTQASLDLEEAVKVLADTRARLEYARASIAWGSMLRRTGFRKDARAPLRRGRELALRCGASPLVEEAEQELRAAGGYLVTRPVTGVAALTPSERRVVERAARGQSNAQIAQALFVSLKTVEMHLSRSYQKLGIRSRDQLAGLL